MSKRAFKIKGYGDEKDISDSKISEYSTIDYPLFSFKYLCSNISIKKCSRGKFFFNFLSRLKELSNAGWKVIEKSDRHSLGTEKMPTDKIRPQLPAIITPDVKYLTVFRAGGDNHVFLGLRNGKVFHVIFIEAELGDVYSH